MNSQRRVVVTGMGVVTPIGTGVDEFKDALIEGRNGIGYLDSSGYFSIKVAGQVNDFPIKVAGQVRDFDVQRFGVKSKDVKKLDRFTQFAIAATELALRDACIKIGEGEEEISPHEIDIFFGVGFGGVDTLMGQFIRCSEGKHVSPFTVTKSMPNAAAAQTSIHFGVKGDTRTYSAACASSGSPINDAYKLISSGERDVVIVGGLEAAINQLSLLSFDSMRALSHISEPRYKVYDKGSDGFVMGEGSGVMIFESEEHALSRRGAEIYAEIVGYGATSDAEHIASPDMEGRQLTRAINLALEDAGIRPDEIDHINSHGTGTINDGIEKTVVKNVFGEDARKIPFSSIKPMIGHLLGAATAVETIAAILGIRYNFIPPIINLENPINGDDLDYVMGEARTGVDLRNVLKFSSGFGGHNITIVLRKYE